MRWSSWRSVLDLDEKWNEEHSVCCFPGIYQIRMITKRGKPIVIPRIRGEDRQGILYIGSAAARRTKTHRCLGWRIWEFPGGEIHSGGYTYNLARRRLPEHGLQFRTFRTSRGKVSAAEKRTLMRYFRRFGELPPFNGSFPGRWD